MKKVMAIILGISLVYGLNFTNGDLQAAAQKTQPIKTGAQKTQSTSLLNKAKSLLGLKSPKKQNENSYTAISSDNHEIINTPQSNVKNNQILLSVPKNNATLGISLEISNSDNSNIAEFKTNKSKPDPEETIEKLNSAAKIKLRPPKLTVKQKEEQNALPVGQRLVSKTGTALGIKSQGLLIKKPLDFEDGLTQQDIKNLTDDQFDFAFNVIEKITAKSPILQKNKNVFGKKTATLLSDANSRIKRISELNTKTRDTIQATFKNMRAAESKFELTDNYELSSLANFSQKTESEKFKAYQQKTAETLIQSQIDNVFGVNPLSGKSNFSLAPKVQEKMVKTIKASKMFEKKLEPFERFQAIADMSDAIMNELAMPEDTGNSTSQLKPIATFKTTIRKDGTYQSTITNDADASSSITVNDSGVTTERIFTIPKTDTTPATVFTSTINPKTGASMTIMQDEAGQIKYLSAEEDSLIKVVHEQLKTMANVKSIIKATLWAGKQSTLNFIPMPANLVESLCVAAVAPIAIKGASMLMGYKWSDPTVRTTINAAMEMTFGNSRGWLSADQDRVFTKGSAPSRVLQVMQGKGNLTDAQFGKATYQSITSLSSKPLRNALRVAADEQIDPREEYYHAIDDTLTEAAIDMWQSVAGAKSLLPRQTISGKVAAASNIFLDAIENNSLSSVWLAPQKYFSKK